MNNISWVFIGKNPTSTRNRLRLSPVKILIVTVIAWSQLCLANTIDELAQGFDNPPDESRPLTWLHVMSGNMSREGITRDLESIAQVGIGGVMLFNVTQGVPIGPIKFNSDEHIELIGHMAAEAKRLGLRFGVHNCDGWTSSGGPWVTPEQSMKRVVSTATPVFGGGFQEILLGQPDITAGLYRDIAVLAYPMLEGERRDFQAQVTLSSPAHRSPLWHIQDGRGMSTATLLAVGENREALLDFAFDQPQPVRSVHIEFKDGRKIRASLWHSKDGEIYEKVQDLQTSRTGKRNYAIDNSFEVVRSRYFRVVFNGDINVMEARLSVLQRIDETLGRTSMARLNAERIGKLKAVEPGMAIDKSRILDVTKALGHDGIWRGHLPSGDWTLLRIGYTSTGAINIPASLEGTGLEVDKFSREAFKAHYDAYVGRVLDKIKDLVPEAMHYVEIDSYEVGGQNWTAGYADIFAEKKQYSILPFLPVFSGRYVDNADTTEAVLWDLRDVNAQLIRDNYYAYFDELANADGLTSYIEPYGLGPFNTVGAGIQADIPMGEFWLDGDKWLFADAVSSARTAGKPVISAESFTASPQKNWRFHPASAKHVGDYAMTQGINQFVFHRFAHQANTHVEPGMVMNQWGAHFDRTNTWWESAGKLWFAYMSRLQHVLRQGTAGSDVLIYAGDSAPSSCPERKRLTRWLPENWHYDCVDRKAFLNAEVKKNKIHLPSGARYQALVLLNTESLTGATLDAIEKFARKGVPIMGERPQSIAGFYQKIDADIDLAKRVDALWSRKNVTEPLSWQVFSEQNTLVVPLTLRVNDTQQLTQPPSYAYRTLHDGEIFFIANPEARAINLTAEFSQKKRRPEIWDPMSGERRELIHYKKTANELLVPLSLGPHQALVVALRKTSKKESVVSAVQSPSGANYSLARDEGSRMVELLTDTAGEYVLEFEHGGAKTVRVKTLPEPQTFEGEWTIVFSKLDRAPVVTDTLFDWRFHDEQAIQYYSGSARYQFSFHYGGNAVRRDLRALLDLGEVAVVAEVLLNGEHVMTSWMPPHRIDITDVVRPGQNTLEIVVTNLWPNRLIGDEALADTSGFVPSEWVPRNAMPAWYVDNRPPPPGPRQTFTTKPFYKVDDPLLPSGLLGPVTLHHRSEMQVEPAK